jgi:bile acid:Na+ symporter, BASS family
VKAIASLSAFVGKTFALWVILFAVLGFVLPDTFKQLAPYIVTLLGIIMFGMGLTLSLDDFKEVARRPVDVGIGVAAQFLIMPIVAVILTMIIPMSPEVAAGVILVGCCPGGTSSNVMTYLSKGDVALSVACTSVTTLAAPIVTPFLVWLFASQFLPVDAMAMFISIVKVILLPLALGFLLQKLLPGMVKAAVPALPLVSVVGIVLIVAAVVGADDLRRRRAAQRDRLSARLPSRARVRAFGRQAQGDRHRGRHAEQRPWRSACQRAFFAGRRRSERHLQRLAQYFRRADCELLFAGTER